MSETKDISPAYECVQPELGDQIWRLEDPTTAADLEARLRRHLAVCDSCRLPMAMGERLIEGAASGRLRMKAEARPDGGRWAATVLTGAGITALAASLVLLLIMPPRDLADGRWRSEDAPGFIRPLEGEVVLDAAPELSWTPIEGATAYEVSLSDADGSYAWSARITEPRTRVPEDRPLPDGVDVRALVTPMPADLAPVGEISVSFRRDGPTAFAADRLKRVSITPAILAALGVALATLGAVRRRHARVV